VKRIGLLAFAVVGFVALAQAQTQGQHGTQSSPAQVGSRGGNCEYCRQKLEACNNEDRIGKPICQRAAMQCQCPN
jgi:hypothetical protein